MRHNGAILRIVAHSHKGGDYMVDTDALRASMRASGLKNGYIAEKLDISVMSLHRKVNGVTEFKASEIVGLSDILHLTKAERDRIFLQ